MRQADSDEPSESKRTFRSRNELRGAPGAASVRFDSLAEAALVAERPDEPTGRFDKFPTPRLESSSQTRDDTSSMPAATRVVSVFLRNLAAFAACAQLND